MLHFKTKKQASQAKPTYRIVVMSMVKTPVREQLAELILVSIFFENLSSQILHLGVIDIIGAKLSGIDRWCLNYFVDL